MEERFPYKNFSRAYTSWIKWAEEREVAAWAICDEWRE